MCNPLFMSQIPQQVEKESGRFFWPAFLQIHSAYQCFKFDRILKRVSVFHRVEAVAGDKECIFPYGYMDGCFLAEMNVGKFFFAYLAIGSQIETVGFSPLDGKQLIGVIYRCELRYFQLAEATNGFSIYTAHSFVENIDIR